jgi:hypothetical protein
MKNRLFTHSSTEYCGESNEIVLFVFVTNVVIVNKQPGLHLCYVHMYLHINFIGQEAMTDRCSLPCLKWEVSKGKLSFME